MTDKEKQVIENVSGIFETNGMVLIMGYNYKTHTTNLVINGYKEHLIKLVKAALAQDSVLEKVVMEASKEYAIERLVDNATSKRRVAQVSVNRNDDIVTIANKLIEDLDCEACVNKDKCDIYEALQKVDENTNLKELLNRISTEHKNL